MSRLRYAAVALLAVFTYGSLSLTGGYAAYYRSAAYRNSCAALLSDALELPADIGQVIPRARHTREFRNVRVWLPERRGEAAFCESARCTMLPGEADQYELSLRGGRCEVSTRTWLRADYRRILESGLRPGFATEGPERVAFADMDLAFVRDRFRMGLDGASGFVLFDGPRQGRLAAGCNQLNGHAVGRVSLRALFSPQGAGVRLDQVELLVPELPLAALGLAELLGLGPRRGRFDGRLSYAESDEGRRLTLRGAVFDVDLAECTTGLLPRPWRGVVPEVELSELTVVDHRPQRLRFRGLIRDARLGDILAPWDLGAVGGGLELRIEDAELSPDGVERLVASGRCEELLLEELSGGLGFGKLSGTARVTIDDLTIVQNRLASFAAVVVVTPNAAGAPGWIERTLLVEAARRALGLDLPEFLLRQLPERIEYSALGVRLEVQDEELHIYGTHGPREKTILTVRIADRDFGVLREPAGSIALKPMLDDLRARLAAEIERGLQQLETIQAAQRAPPTAPE
ncbi:MAG: hypothetical protein AB1716_18020 [Planctomycetota bacterium]